MESNRNITFSSGDEVIDINGNNAVVSEIFPQDCLDYDPISKSLFPLDMSNKIKLKYDTGFTKIVGTEGIQKGKNKIDISQKHILETVYEMDTNSMSQEMIDRLFTVINLHSEFYKNALEYSPGLFLPKPILQLKDNDAERKQYLEQNIIENCFNNVLVNLKIELPSDRIKTIYKKYGVIQLREIDSKTLTLGCGSEPLIYGTSRAGYTEKHAHANEITMSPELHFNPTVVGFFEGKFKFNDNYFERVIFESFMYSDLHEVISGLTEVKRILAFNGKVTFKVADREERTFGRDRIDIIIATYQKQSDFSIFRSELSSNLTSVTAGFFQQDAAEVAIKNDDQSKPRGPSGIS